MNTNADLNMAHSAGREAARAFLDRLAAVESAERTERLSRLVFDPSDPPLEVSLPPNVVELQNNVARLAAFHEAVVRSRSWIWLQRIRRLAGRAW
jgi:hypothetical protein